MLDKKYFCMNDHWGEKYEYSMWQMNAMDDVQQRFEIEKIHYRRINPEVSNNDELE